MSYRHNTEDRPPLPGAGYCEDYTIPFLIAAGVWCFIVLFAIWATFGLPAALGLAFAADRLLPR